MRTIELSLAALVLAGQGLGVKSKPKEPQGYPWQPSYTALAPARAALQQTEDQAESYVLMKTERRDITPKDHAGHLTRRSVGDDDDDLMPDGTSQGDLKNRQIGYFVTIGVGTPPQNISVHLDTGSSDTWVPSYSSHICTVRGGNQCAYGSFKSHLSDSFEIIGKKLFGVKYFDKSFAKGDYISETVSVGGARLPNTILALSHENNIPWGLAGIGYKIHNKLDITGKVYENLPNHLQRQGIIKTVAYSLWLNDVKAEEGNILFGGIDLGKFTGELKTVPLIRNQNGEYDFFNVPLTGVRVVGPERDNDLPMDENVSPVPAILDSGATLSFLPNDLAHAIWREAGAVWFRDVGAAMVPCDKRENGDVFAFRFGPRDRDGPTIRVPVSQLVLNTATWPNGQPIVGSKADFEGKMLCQFGVRNHTETPFILGDSFLRSAYVVHDMTNNEVGLAQASFNSTTTKIVSFKNAGDTIGETLAWVDKPQGLGRSTL